VGFDDVAAANGKWRVYVIQQRGLTIEVAQPAAVRNQLAFNAAWRTLLPFLLALPLMGLLIWRLVGEEMRVLETTAQAIARRSPESLEPIESHAVPEEVRPLVDALNGLLSRLDAALSHQRQFIADAAHELRTPLTALKLQLQLAERAPDEARRAQAHETLRAGIDRATHLVAQLLTLAREDPDAPIDLSSAVDLTGLALSTLQDFETPAAAKGLQLVGRIDEGVVARGHAAALRAMLGNLLDNAIRYTARGTVTVRAHERAGAAVLEVEDTGPGIPREERERVFDRFFRGEDVPSGGAGLGLAIVRRIAQRHGARVELLDAPGGGLLARVAFQAVESDATGKPLEHG
jgi:two-component system OmpR family sensor kinase